jgi:hypothetical protein
LSVIPQKGDLGLLGRYYTDEEKNMHVLRLEIAATLRNDMKEGICMEHHSGHDAHYSISESQIRRELADH